MFCFFCEGSKPAKKPRAPKGKQTPKEKKEKEKQEQEQETEKEKEKEEADSPAASKEATPPPPPIAAKKNPQPTLAAFSFMKKKDTPQVEATPEVPPPEAAD